ncbi:GNAT family N-acetyltransferase [Longimicrobium terrae]|uniref:Ribosomal-protein-alanine N-acetyltransferase n=1 Tax=Longimicrobium terrae TaxID=1639882 RepID=A0A841GWL3_9BACT|nr:GNAT family N-acetyltransferase [Longimicrobium terrae]MBB4635719.1 ribosomal-protein-alanine N-acetyltransferase [Longimicrobium terrae]MBB6070113.1 ribosomal-protein-alanine N-acetyltransferase [Longimicrobium terrae]NNC33016.1 GNAT family N-acetyltransferase [Longimicrobium terrae]
MLTPMRLTTPRLIVRLAEADDVSEIVRFFSDNREHLAESRPRMGAEFFTAGFWAAQVRANLAEFRDGRSVRLFFFDAARPERVVGNANFTQIFRSPAYCCVLGYGLDREYEGRGVMREALEAALGYMFTEQNMHRIEANYIPRNERSGRLLRRLGFVVEGFARDYLLLNGKWEDHVRTSLTNPAWREY